MRFGGAKANLTPESVSVLDGVLDGGWLPSPVSCWQNRHSFLFYSIFFFSPNTVIAKAVKTGAGAALIHINFTAGPSEAPATVTAEAQREMVLIQLLHAHRAVLARTVGLAG